MDNCIILLQSIYFLIYKTGVIFLEAFLQIFNIISGLCSIASLIIAIVTVAKVNKLYIVSFNKQDASKRNNIDQINKGTGNINYNIGDKNG